jgi:hypothetical protein
VEGVAVLIPRLETDRLFPDRVENPMEEANRFPETKLEFRREDILAKRDEINDVDNEETTALLAPRIVDTLKEERPIELTIMVEPIKEDVVKVLTVILEVVIDEI